MVVVEDAQPPFSVVSVVDELLDEFRDIPTVVFVEFNVICGQYICVMARIGEMVVEWRLCIRSFSLLFSISPIFSMR